MQHIRMLLKIASKWGDQIQYIKYSTNWSQFFFVFGIIYRNLWKNRFSHLFDFKRSVRMWNAAGNRLKSRKKPTALHLNYKTSSSELVFLFQKVYKILRFYKVFRLFQYETLVVRSIKHNKLRLLYSTYYYYPKMSKKMWRRPPPPDNNVPKYFAPQTHLRFEKASQKLLLPDYVVVYKAKTLYL